ncbi:UPF0158 family protein [Bailinhaonella thermotolerans]|uniref:UPF0158 family protein n=1 Tax=Bailinhaonella thermotolerans TaxID=1070861 RepID=UPI00192A1C28|nr:UPF0158 family protein [Bailinhaonella thermotolerans]
MTTYPAFAYDPPRPPIEQVFQVLAQVVRDLQSEGRSTRSAGIKPRLAQRLGAFTEKTYGFTTFREFLMAAQRAGVVELCNPAQGPDLDVMLPGQPRDVPRPPVPLQVRQDLWKEFMDWSPGVERAYDRQKDRAFRVSVTDAYDPEARRLREAMQADPARFVPISPISMETQIQWARSFVTKMPPGRHRDELAQTLHTDRPLQGFTRLVRTLPCLAEWTSFRNERVVEAVTSWARHHDLDVDPVATDSSPHRSSSNPASPHAPAAAGQLDLAALRARAHELVDVMTAEELLALPLSLGMLYRR